MQNKLPADPSAMIIGIVGIVIGLAGCCCYGFTAIIPLILSVVGLIYANKSLRLYRENPDAYTESSRSNVSMSKILNIISIVFNGLIFFVILFFVVFIGVAGTQGYLDELKNNTYPTDDWDYQDYEEDAYYDGEDVYEIEEVDSISTDSIFLQEVFPETDTLNN